MKTAEFFYAAYSFPLVCHSGTENPKSSGSGSRSRVRNDFHPGQCIRIERGAFVDFPRRKRRRFVRKHLVFRSTVLHIGLATFFLFRRRRSIPAATFLKNGRQIILPTVYVHIYRCMRVCTIIKYEKNGWKSWTFMLSNFFSTLLIKWRNVCNINLLRLILFYSGNCNLNCLANELTVKIQNILADICV